MKRRAIIKIEDRATCHWIAKWGAYIIFSHAVSIIVVNVFLHEISAKLPEYLQFFFMRCETQNNTFFIGVFYQILLFLILYWIMGETEPKERKR